MGLIVKTILIHSYHLSNFILSVSDSLDYSPEKATIVAMYKKIVVGVAILSSPRETYITYLAVKAGWDKAQIGRLVAIFQEFHLQRILISFPLEQCCTT